MSKECPEPHELLNELEPVKDIKDLLTTDIWKCQACGYKWPPWGEIFPEHCPKCRAEDLEITWKTATMPPGTLAVYNEVPV